MTTHHNEKQTQKLPHKSARRRARECTVQAIYSWQISQSPVEQIELHFVTDQDMQGVDMPHFRRLLRGVVSHIETVDALLAPYLDRQADAVDPIERSVLRMAAYELKFEHDVPFKVVINEAIEVAKEFGSDDSHKFVNGVLDKLVPTLNKK